MMCVNQYFCWSSMKIIFPEQQQGLQQWGVNGYFLPITIFSYLLGALKVIGVQILNSLTPLETMLHKLRSCSYLGSIMLKKHDRFCSGVVHFLAFILSPVRLLFWGTLPIRIVFDNGAFIQHLSVHSVCCQYIVLHEYNII